MSVTLGLDLGSASIGWSLVDKENQKIIDSGVRIYDSGFEGETPKSIHSERGKQIRARRNKTRQDRRVAKVANLLKSENLLPSDRKEREKIEVTGSQWFIHPIQARADAVSCPVDRYVFGRAVLHLAKHRGFRANTKFASEVKIDDESLVESNSDSEEEKEQKRLMKSINTTESVMDGRTPGEYLNDRRKSHQSVVAKPLISKSKIVGYDFMFSRSMILDEFNRMVDMNKSSLGLSDEFIDELRSAVFFQRPLKPANRGKCAVLFDQVDEDGNKFVRSSKWLPSTEMFNLLETINSLRVVDGAGSGQEDVLTMEQRNALVKLAINRKHKGKLTYENMLKVIQGDFSSPITFSVMKSSVKNISVPVVIPFLGGIPDEELSSPDALIGRLKYLDEAAEVINAAEDADDVVVGLSALGFDSDGIKDALKARLVTDVSHLSSRAIYDIMPYLVVDVVPFVTAKNLAYPELNKKRLSDGKYKRLPYYGEVLPEYVVPVARLNDNEVVENNSLLYGRIGNPNVHLGLNQLRIVVNEILDRYGNKYPIELSVVETGREYGISAKTQKARKKEREENTEKRGQLKEDLLKEGVKDTASNQEKLKLWREMTPDANGVRICVYCGGDITWNDVFGEHPAVNKDHIIPFSRCVDDSFKNKVLVHGKCNGEKNDFTPFEKWGGESAKWKAIRKNAAAMFGGESAKYHLIVSRKPAESDGFAPRQLNDVAYLSKVAIQYLSSVFPNVVGFPSMVTDKVRTVLDLDSILSREFVEFITEEEEKGKTKKQIHHIKYKKNRKDRRHHAVDAIAIAVGVGQERKYLKWDKKHLVDGDIPWKGFRNDVMRRMSKLHVSVKPEHSVSGKLMLETNQKLAGGIRKAFNALSPVDQARARAGETIKNQKYANGKNRGVVFIFDDSGNPIRAVEPHNNLYIEFYKSKNGKTRSNVVSLFRANQKDYKAFMNSNRFSTQTFEGYPLVNRFYKDDLVMFAPGVKNQNKKLNESDVYRVNKFSDGAIHVMPAKVEPEKGDAGIKCHGAKDYFRKVVVSPTGFLKRY